METPLPRGPRLWLFRLAAMTLIPAAFFLALELALRLAGFGYPTGFLVDAPRSDAVMTNQKFGWRFFPRKLARAPVPSVVDVAVDVPGDAVYRIVIIGGSAARGTPEPAFSFGRILEAMLSSVYPNEDSGMRFEVLSGAMTAINSHVALPIVRDAGRLHPALFVVYLGNNEVVGPYGAATVSSPTVPRLAVIRAGLAAKAWRLGQLVDLGVGGRAAKHSEWRGMEMFLEQRIVASDPGLVGVYDHLRANLTDLVDAARGAGAQVLLSTMAVNLRDLPPFASLHRPGLGKADIEHFDELLTTARAALEGGDPATALAHLAAAEGLDGEYAELHFHRGHTLLALGRGDEARESLGRARDLDTLRFRADSRTNAVIAGVAAAEGVPLVDAEAFFLEGAGLVESLPGRRLFYEHVHLNFAGNHALARIVFEQIEKLLPPEITGGRSGAEPPGMSAVAEKLAFTIYDAEGMEREILRLVSRPPFTGQWGHREDLIARRELLRRMRQGFGDELWQRSSALYEARLAAREDDLQTRRCYAELLERHGDSERAVEHWQKLLEAIPDILSWHDAYALALAGAGRGREAIEALERARERFPEEEAGILVNLGSVYEQAGKNGKAADAYRRSWEADPSVAVALYNLATLQARGGDLDSAVELYRELLEHHPHFTRGHHNLGVAFERQGDLGAAARSYRREIASSPEDPAGYNSLGLVLTEQGDPEGALDEYIHALERDPGHAPALFNLADLLLSRGRAKEALAYYEKGLVLEPGNLQARSNLAAAYRTVGGSGL